MVREGKEKGDGMMDSFGLQPYNQRKNIFGPPAQLYLPRGSGDSGGDFGRMALAYAVARVQGQEGDASSGA